MKIQSQGRFFYVELPNGQILAKYDYDELLMNINKLGFDIDKNQNENVSITLDGKNNYFLCSWNGTEIIQIHTIETLREEYKETNLFDNNDWSYDHKNDLSVIEVMYSLINNCDVFTIIHNDNMSIQYIKEKE